MRSAPEFAYIVMMLGVFIVVFAISNLTARARGYRE
jgi:hypothetical protein